MVKRKTRIYDEYLHRVKKLIDEKPREVIGTERVITNRIKSRQRRDRTSWTWSR